MEHVIGRVLDGDAVIADGVEITLVVNPGPGRKHWYGCFVFPGRWSSHLTGPLRLEFEDGRSGEIQVRGAKHPTPEQTTVLFNGASALT